MDGNMPNVKIASELNRASKWINKDFQGGGLDTIGLTYCSYVNIRENFGAHLDY